MAVQGLLRAALGGLHALRLRRQIPFRASHVLDLLLRLLLSLHLHLHLVLLDLLLGSWITSRRLHGLDLFVSLDLQLTLFILLS